MGGQDTINDLTVPDSAGHDLLRAVAATARTAFAAGACSIALLSDDGDELVFRVVDGRGEGAVGQGQAADRGLAGWAVATGQAIAVADVTRDPRFAPEIAEAAGYMPSALMAAPMVAGGETVGVIEILDPAQDAVAGRGLELLGRFADEAAMAVQMATDATGPAPADALAADLAALARVGNEERALAQELVRALLAYIAGARRR